MRTVQWILLGLAGLYLAWDLLAEREPPRLQRPGLWLFSALAILTALPAREADRSGVWDGLIYLSMACSGLAITFMVRQLIRHRRAKRAEVGPSNR